MNGLKSENVRCIEMNDYVKQIAYNEGFKAFHDDVRSIACNPYDGVSVILANHWEQGFWDAWYED